MLIIEKLYAYIAIDKEGEGVMGMSFPDGQWFPLVGADLMRTDSIREKAKMISDATKIPYKLVEFSNKKILEEYQPKEQQ